VRQFGAALVALALAVVAAVVGVLLLTVWRPADQVVASAAPGEPYVMTRDGVLPLQGDGRQVTVTVESADPGQEVSLVLGTTSDVLGWIGDSGYTEVVGIAEGWTDLKVVDHPAERESAEDAQSGGTAQSGEDAQSGSREQSGGSATSAETAQSGEAAASPLDNDMWLERASGTGSASLTLTDVPAGRSVLAAAEGARTAPGITIAWAVHQTNGAAIAAFSLAGLFLVVAAALSLLELRTLRHRRNRARLLAEQEAADSTATQQLPVEEVMARAGARPEGGTGAGEAPGDGEARDAEDAGAREAPPEAWEEPEPEESPAVERSSLLGRHAAGPAGDEDPPETVPTDSGIIDVSAIREGMAFPSRRALREARDRGEGRFVVDGHEFDTGVTRAVRPAQGEAPRHSGRTGRWTSLMSSWTRRAPKGDSDAQDS
jgi:hypothetical protein